MVCVWDSWSECPTRTWKLTFLIDISVPFIQKYSVKISTISTSHVRLVFWKTILKFKHDHYANLRAFICVNIVFMMSIRRFSCLDLEQKNVKLLCLSSYKTYLLERKEKYFLASNKILRALTWEIGTDPWWVSRLPIYLHFFPFFFPPFPN